MKILKRTVLFEEHVRLKASMVDFGGWEMPVNYPGGIVNEHLYTRQKAGLFDVSHMGRFVVKGAGAVPFLQYVLSNNVSILNVKKAQYTMIPNENGGAIDDAYLYRFYDDEYMLVVNASNAEKDWDYLISLIKGFDAEISDVSEDYAMIAIQGPETGNILVKLSDNDKYFDSPARNSLGVIALDGCEVLISKTGYTGERNGFELFIKRADAVHIWSILQENGAIPVGLGARDTLRLEAGLPLYGHELGQGIDGEEIKIFACPIAKYAVSFADEKGDFIGRKALLKQYEALQKMQAGDFSKLADLSAIIRHFALTGSGIARQGFKVFKEERQIGYVTSGTMVPYLIIEGQYPDITIKDEKGMRAIGSALLSSDIAIGEKVKIEVRKNRVNAIITQSHLKWDNMVSYAMPAVYSD